MTANIKVAVAGALGRMGQETARAALAEQDIELVGLADARATGKEYYGLPLYPDVDTMLEATSPQIMVDFTVPASVMDNALTAIRRRVTPVIGTSGLGEHDLLVLEQEANRVGVGVAVIPNFAIGAVLMMKMAREAARYFPQVEIIELHHDQKLDSPSGTAIKTAQMIAEDRGSEPGHPEGETEKMPGARGCEIEGVHIHSVRLPGLVAHQEVLLGGRGQLLSIRHDSFNRESFMPGVILTIRKMVNRQGLVYGLENLI